MKRILTYPREAIFPKYKYFKKIMERKNLIKEKNMYLIAGSNYENFLVFYDSKKDKIKIELKGKTLDDIVKGALSFFKIIRYYQQE